VDIVLSDEMRLVVAARAVFIVLISVGHADANRATSMYPGFPTNQVISLAISYPSHSWEFGISAEAQLELYDSSLSVFGSSPFPPQAPFHVNNITALSYAKSKIVFGQGVNSLADGDGAVGDPASLGVSAWMLGQSDDADAARYAAAADQTIQYLINRAPRAANGAISHRVDIVELW
jgi:hypothetical protein